MTKRIPSPVWEFFLMQCVCKRKKKKRKAVVDVDVSGIPLFLSGSLLAYLVQ
jgi:hypothetical protein